jgi:hypothetical protein
MAHFAKWRNTIGYAILALQSRTLHMKFQTPNTLKKITQTKIKNQSTASKKIPLKETTLD